MNRIFEAHRQRNADSRDRWECFAGHRRRVTELLLADQVHGDRSLCVLGAGNCNDLDLLALAEAYSDVHLVDLDDDAVRAGIAAQRSYAQTSHAGGVADLSNLHVHGGIDLTGCTTLTSGWNLERAPADDALQRCVELVTEHTVPQIPGPFDVVASVCLLTQLFDSVVFGLGDSHPRFLELLMCIRLRHIRLLFELLRPGGAAILITDFVSSASYPPLTTTSEQDLPALASQLIQSRNFFTGANPAALYALFETDPIVSPQLRHMSMSRPWLWDFGPRTYAVCAIRASTQASEAGDRNDGRIG